MRGELTTNFKPGQASVAQRLHGLQASRRVTPSRRSAFQKAEPGRPATDWERAETRRREKKLIRFHQLIASGYTRVKAAKRLRVSPTTMFRYERRIEPSTRMCGRTPLLKKYQVTAAILSRVQRLQLAGGRGNEAAWFALAKEKICPSPLAAFLRKAQSIPHSFLDATRLRRRTVKLVEGSEFIVLNQAKGKAA